MDPSPHSWLHRRDAVSCAIVSPTKRNFVMQDFSAIAERDSVEVAIGEALVASGKLSAAGLDRALRLKTTGGDQLLALLTKLGMVSERDVAEALAVQLGLAIVAAGEFPDAPPLEDQLGANFLRHAKVLPLAEDGDLLSLAMADPLDQVTIRAIELRTRRRVRNSMARIVTWSSGSAIASDRRSPSSASGSTLAWRRK